jgi:hypothetical protein
MKLVLMSDLTGAVYLVCTTSVDTLTSMGLICCLDVRKGEFVTIMLAFYHSVE